MQLQPCGGCRRHVSTSERACPFCGAPASGLPPRLRPVLGRVTRAAIFASTSAAAACWTNSSPATSSTTSTTTSTGPVEGHAGKHEDTWRPPRPSPGTTSIGGIVRNSATGKPFAGVTVQCIPDSGKVLWTQTDNAGHYVFASIPPGPYQVTFRPPNDPGRMAPEPHAITAPADDIAEVNISVEEKDWSNIPMPYGAPPRRRRVV